MAETIKFTSLIPLAKLAKGPRDFLLQPTAEDCAVIAERLGLASINQLSATVTMEDRGRVKGVFLNGTIHADFEQYCAVTLDPFANSLSFPFTLRLIGGEELARLDEAEAYLDPEVEEYDALDGDEIDLGEIIVQSLSMEIDPHAKFVDMEEIDGLASKVDVNEGPEKRPNPFAVLEKLKKNS